METGYIKFISVLSLNLEYAGKLVNCVHKVWMLKNFSLFTWDQYFIKQVCFVNHYVKISCLQVKSPFAQPSYYRVAAYT